MLNSSNGYAYSDVIKKNDLLLARYTCVALQRLNGSAKKVKGKYALPIRIVQLLNVLLRLSHGQDTPS